MTIYRRVPSLDDNGQFPDRYAPPSVAIDAAAAAQSALDAAATAESIPGAVGVQVAAQVPGAVGVQVAAQVPGAVGVQVAAQVAPAVAVAVAEFASLDAAVTSRLRTARQAFAQRSGTDRLAGLRDFSIGAKTLALASDSTGNDASDWFRIFVKDFGATLPATMRREYRRWYDGTGYTVTVDADGVGTPASDGVMMHDTFTRTAADVSGSVSDNGKTWTATSGKVSITGTAVTHSGSTSGTMSYDVASRDVTTSAILTVITTAPAATISRRIYAAATTSGLVSGVWASYSVNTSGNSTIALWKTISGVSTQIGTTTAVPAVTSNSATPQTVQIDVTVAIQNLSVTITANGTPLTLTGQITESDYAALGTWSGVAFYAGPSTHLDLTEITMTTAATPARYDGLTVLNTAVAGTTLAYPQGLLATMFPSTVDVLMVTTGHNYTTDTPAAFLVKVAAFVTAFVAAHPETCLVFTSQNPQKAPAVNVAAHAARQQALRAWATEMGYEYLPVFETFAAQPDGGVSLIGADGVHPTTPPLDSLATWSGARLWADVALAAIDARSYTA